MRTVSLWQPYASLLVSAAKIYETRSWETMHRGWLAVHASKGGLSKREYIETLAKPHFRDHVREPIPRGAIVGVVFLETCRRIVLCDHCDGCGWYEGGKSIQTTCTECSGTGARPDGKFLTPQEAAFGNYDLSEGTRYAWVTSQNKPLATPIPFSGKQGIFSLPAPIVSEILKQVTLT